MTEQIGKIGEVKKDNDKAGEIGGSFAASTLQNLQSIQGAQGADQAKETAPVRDITDKVDIKESKKSEDAAGANNTPNVSALAGNLDASKAGFEKPGVQPGFSSETVNGIPKLNMEQGVVPGGVMKSPPEQYAA